MQTIEEYKAYTKQLESEVGKWHHAYEALMVERNALVKEPCGSAEPATGRQKTASNIAEKKSRNYFLRHCNDPVWRSHRLEVQMAWKARRKAAKILAGIPFEITFTFQDAGTTTVHIYKGVV